MNIEQFLVHILVKNCENPLFHLVNATKNYILVVPDLDFLYNFTPVFTRLNLPI